MHRRRRLPLHILPGERPPRNRLRQRLKRARSLQRTNDDAGAVLRTTHEREHEPRLAAQHGELGLRDEEREGLVERRVLAVEALPPARAAVGLCLGGRGGRERLLRAEDVAVLRRVPVGQEGRDGGGVQDAADGGGGAGGLGLCVLCVGAGEEVEQAVEVGGVVGGGDGVRVERGAEAADVAGRVYEEEAGEGDGGELDLRVDVEGPDAGEDVGVEEAGVAEGGLVLRRDGEVFEEGEGGVEEG